MQKTLVLFLVVGTLAFAGNAGKSISEPSSDVVAVPSVPTGAYVGLGFGEFRLNAGTTHERLSSAVGVLRLGYALSDWFSVEGRYVRGAGGIRYNGGSYSPKKTTLASTFSNLAIYTKLNLPGSKISPYILGGYGRTLITDLSHADRSERGWQYGVGADLHLDPRLDLYADWVRLYRGQGFSGRSRAESVTVGVATFGLRYRF